MTGRVFHVGDSEAVRAALLETFGSEPKTGSVRNLESGDVVVIEVFAALTDREDIAGGNAFSACKVWKEERGVAVYAVVRDDDPVGVQLARFVLVDGVMVLTGSGQLQGLEQLTPKDHKRPGRLIDALLERFGTVMDDEDRGSRALERMLEWEREDHFLARLQDEETGLFDGPYAALKLEEEFKRA